MRLDVSIIMPVYNAERHLRYTIESLLDQSIDSYEIIVVDDGSTDSTEQIIHDFRDEKIKYYKKKNGGAASARNFGLEFARGTFIMFLDSDDLFDRCFLQKMLDSAIETSSDIVVCQAEVFDSNTGKNLGKFNSPTNFPQGVYSREEYLPSLYQSFTSVPWDKLYRRSLIESKNLRFQNLMYSNDNFFVLMALAEADKVSVLSDVLVFYRVGAGSSLRDNMSKNPLCDLLALDAIFTAVKNEGGFKEPLATSFRTFCVDIFINSVSLLVEQNYSSARIFVDEFFSKYEPKWGISSLTYKTCTSKANLWKYQCARHSSTAAFLWACGVRRNARNTVYGSRSALQKTKYMFALIIARMFSHRLESRVSDACE